MKLCHEVLLKKEHKNKNKKTQTGTK